METTKVILVDDEIDSLEAIEEQLKLYCDNVEVLGIYNDSELGLEAIIEKKPDVAFLDIQMPKKNGLEIAKEISKYNINVVFITAYEKFAIEAFRLSAVHYILKPLQDGTELKEVFRRIDVNYTKQLPVFETLVENKKSNSYSQETEIALVDAERVRFFKINEIIRLKAEGNNCQFFFTENRKMLVTKNMKTYSDPLEKYGLVRVSRSEVINLEHRVEIIKKGGPYVLLSDGSKVEITDTYRKNLPYYNKKSSFSLFGFLHTIFFRGSTS